jgi:hypothetical protein
MNVGHSVPRFQWPDNTNGSASRKRLGGLNLAEHRMALNRETTHAYCANFERLISVSAPFWAGEAEVVRTYWDSPVRNVHADMDWLRRQCIKEFNGTGGANTRI